MEGRDLGEASEMINENDDRVSELAFGGKDKEIGPLVERLKKFEPEVSMPMTECSCV